MVKITYVSNKRHRSMPERYDNFDNIIAEKQCRENKKQSAECSEDSAVCCKTVFAVHAQKCECSKLFDNCLATHVRL